MTTSTQAALTVYFETIEVKVQSSTQKNILKYKYMYKYKSNWPMSDLQNNHVCACTCTCLSMYVCTCMYVHVCMNVCMLCSASPSLFLYTLLLAIDRIIALGIARRLQLLK